MFDDIAIACWLLLAVYVAYIVVERIHRP